MGDKPKLGHSHTEDIYRQRIVLLRQQIAAERPTDQVK
jgi:hypothetical protein